MRTSRILLRLLLLVGSLIFLLDARHRGLATYSAECGYYPPGTAGSAEPEVSGLCGSAAVHVRARVLTIMKLLNAKSRRLATAASLRYPLLLSVVLVREFLLPPRARRAAGPERAVGTNLKSSLPGLDWGKNGLTLILAISTRCHFCTDSAPFFKRVEKERPRDVRLVAVLPQPVDEARKYLDGEGVHVDEVRQASLQSIGVAGTPTLLLVDARGKVSDVWRGKLQPDDEEKVIATLRASASR